MNGTVLTNSSLLPPTHARTNKRYSHIDIRRLHKTIRFGRGDQENAQNIRARSDPHHIAHTDWLILYTPAGSSIHAQLDAIRKT
jgi:hypothetical protein